MPPLPSGVTSRPQILGHRATRAETLANPAADWFWQIVDVIARDDRTVRHAVYANGWRRWLGG